jgi:hypothetical protein
VFTLYDLLPFFGFLYGEEMTIVISSFGTYWGSDVVDALVSTSASQPSFSFTFGRFPFYGIHQSRLC